MFKKFRQTNFYRTIYTFVQMHIIDNLRPIFKKEYKEKRVIIKDRYGNKRKYLLGVSENDYGILFLLNDLNNPCHNYAKGALDKKDNAEA